MSVCLLSSDADLGRVHVLPQFRSDDWEYKEVKCITADRRIQTVVLNEDVLAVMRDNGKQGQAPDTLDDKYVLVCLCAELIVSEWNLFSNTVSCRDRHVFCL